VPGKEIWTEGIIPGKGRIGTYSFKQFIRYIRDNFPDISICVEVANKDFKNPRESEDALWRIQDWL
jgi:hypothetical protein